MAILLPTIRLAKYCNPFGASPWGVRVTRHDVRKALAEKRLVGTPGTDDHAGRIAFLIENSWDDAIDIDVGIPAVGCLVPWYINDGNHRFAASLYSKETHILAGVSGDLAFANRLFGMDCSELSISD